jgi:hypothetical protein
MLKAKTLLVLVLASLMLVLIVATGCQPRQANSDDSEQDNSDTLMVSVEWSPESNCSVCHVSEFASESDNVTLAGIHKMNPESTDSVKCVTCHADTSILAALHKDVTTGEVTVKRLKKTEVASDACTTSGCHDNAEERKTATVGSTILTDQRGTVVNPHDVPINEYHDTISCASCHKGHNAIDAPKTCLSCHHEDVYECNTCHDA